MSLMLVPLNPRRGLIHGLLTVAEVAWLSLAAFRVAEGVTSLMSWAVSLFILAAMATMLGWLTDVYMLPFGFTRFVSLGLTLLSMLAFIRWLGYPSAGLLDWFGPFMRSLIVETRPESVNVFFGVLFVVGYIWWRCLIMGYRPPELSVAIFTLRIGFIGLIVTIILARFGFVRIPSPLPILLFAVTGLLAVSLAYTQTIAQNHGENAVGALLTRLLNSTLAITMVAALAILLIAVFSTSALSFIFDGIFFILGWLFTPVGWLLLWIAELLGPYFDALALWLQSLVLEVEPPSTETAEGAPEPEPFQELEQGEPPWWFRYVQWGWRILVILAVIRFLYWLVGRFTLRRQTVTDLSSNQTHESVSVEAPDLGSLWDRLGNWAGLLGKFGVGQDLRTAVAVRKIYAAMVALASQHDLKRVASQTPTEFLDPLTTQWPPLGKQFSKITNAYIQVHYGQLPEGDAELEAVQRAWHEVYEFFENEKRV